MCISKKLLVYIFEICDYNLKCFRFLNCKIASKIMVFQKIIGHKRLRFVLYSTFQAESSRNAAKILCVFKNKNINFHSNVQ